MLERETHEARGQTERRERKGWELRRLVEILVVGEHVVSWTSSASSEDEICAVRRRDGMYHLWRVLVEMVAAEQAQTRGDELDNGH